MPFSGAQRFGRADRHVSVAIDGDDLARERAWLAKQTSERAAPVGRADDRLCVRVRLDAIALAFALVEEGGERVSSEVLLVAFSAHGSWSRGVVPPSSSQSRSARARIALWSGAIRARSAEDGTVPAAACARVVAMEVSWSAAGRVASETVARRRSLSTGIAPGLRPVGAVKAEHLPVRRARPDGAVESAPLAER